MSKQIITFIGGGNMATSLIGGLVKSGYDAGRIRATDPLDTRCKELASEFGVQTDLDNGQAVNGADLVVLAVKPQVMPSVVKDLAAAANAQRPLMLSIAAGITAPDIARWLGYDAAIVRTMPNTPALVSSGITGMYANSAVTPEQRTAADSVMQAVGQTVWLDDEALLDAVTAISGSGPAYFFLLIELLVASGEQLGLRTDVATQLATQTALGAALMTVASGEAPGVLRQRVTSPGGTTAAALAVFEQGELGKLVAAAATAARDRGAELAVELGDDGTT
jgi:pyrroline-5-carboxylate reductase